jgi:hypothetical protein
LRRFRNLLPESARNNAARPPSTALTHLSNELPNFGNHRIILPEFNVSIALSLASAPRTGNPELLPIDTFQRELILRHSPPPTGSSFDLAVEIRIENRNRASPHSRFCRYICCKFYCSRHSCSLHSRSSFIPK